VNASCVYFGLTSSLVDDMKVGSRPTVNIFGGKFTTMKAKPATIPADTAQATNGHLIGYARVSSQGQDTAVQEAKLRGNGCTIIRTEKASGGSRYGRDELAAIMDFIRAGDTLVVVKLDRLGRSTRDVLNLVHDLEQRGASLQVLEPAIDTGGPMGRMVLTVLGMVAEMELSFIKDRQRAGIEAAKAKGIYKGRPIMFDHKRIVALRKAGMGATKIAGEVGCKRGNVYKVLRANGLT
jgi:DNA invertase Pin-like site-specific DNA recombinase